MLSIRKYESSDCGRLAELFYQTVPAVNARIAGFGDIDKTGYLDRLYVHKDYQNQDIGSAVCDEDYDTLIRKKNHGFTSF